MLRADQVTQGHQLQLLLRGGKLAVTCPCLLTRVRSQDWQPYKIGGVLTARRASYWRREVIEARPCFPAAEAKATWAAWHEQQGIVL